MTESEKFKYHKSIEYVKKIADYFKGYEGVYVIKAITNECGEHCEKVIELIEKLQKENEERKSEIEIFYKWLSFTCKELGISEDTPIIDMLQEIKENYVPKDKIREYIKEKEEEKEGVKNISLEEYAITSKELKESEICLLKCILEEK